MNDEAKKPLNATSIIVGKSFCQICGAIHSPHHDQYVNHAENENGEYFRACSNCVRVYDLTQPEWDINDSEED